MTDNTRLLRAQQPKFHTQGPSFYRYKLNMAQARFCRPRVIVSTCILLIVFPILFWHRDSIKDLSVPYARPHSRPVPQFVAHGNSKCLPEVSQELIEEASQRHVTCRKYSPFVTGRARIATVTAHFGEPQEHYKKAFKTHILHSLIHGTEIKVMCDPIVDDLWNKPAFILQLLMREMLKPAKERLEWIQWVDRDTLILDQCRPISSFLPPEKSRFGSWWRTDIDEEQLNREGNITHLLVNNDLNGLNNGVFLLRVNHWAIELFTAILAFRHYEPNIHLPFTEQSAMEHVLRTEHFRDRVKFVPQSWFNAYARGGAQQFAERTSEEDLQDEHVRRGDYLVHFAGNQHKDQAIEEWMAMLGEMEDVWERGHVQRDVSADIAQFWKHLGFGGRKRSEE